MLFCNLLSHHFWKFTVSEKVLSFGNYVIPKLHIRQNSFNKNVIFVSHHKVVVLTVHNVKLCLELEVVSMAPVIDEAESLVSSMEVQINLVLLAVWALKFTVKRTCKQ